VGFLYVADVVEIVGDRGHRHDVSHADGRLTDHGHSVVGQHGGVRRIHPGPARHAEHILAGVRRGLVIVDDD
jgi:hypothetical protein